MYTGWEEKLDGNRTIDKDGARAKRELEKVEENYVVIRRKLKEVISNIPLGPAVSKGD